MNLSGLRVRTQHFINGRFVNSIKGQTFKLINPADESFLAEVQKGSQEDIDVAVLAAR
jgi:acyl-CoA reductase-like NAD-dependent aldehyde dehydrogenase